MVIGRANPVLHLIRRVAADEQFGGLTDAELLARYAGEGDEAAFEVLLRRHGPLVLGVCRRALGDAHAADDAFQATFLILARKARAIRKSESVASWLHGVARRVAARARESGRVRRWYERRWRRTPPADALREVAWRDVGAILDEEIQRLPERVRAPFVLCYLQGATNDAAARSLGCPTGTVLSRLSKARELLRARLTRRGLALSASLLATSAPVEATAAVPLALSEATLQVVLPVAGPASAVPPAVAALVAGVLRPRPPVGLLTAALGVAAACVVLGPARDPVRSPEVPPAAPTVVVVTARTDLDRLQGTWAVASAVFEGVADAPEVTRRARATFAGDTLTLSGPFGQTQRFSVTVDQAANPAAIDTTALDGPRRGTVTRGVYRFDGDTLQLCMPVVLPAGAVGYNPLSCGPPAGVVAGATKRPDDFAAPRGAFRRLLTLRRVAPES